MHANDSVPLTLVPSGQEIEHVSIPFPSWSHSFFISFGFLSQSLGHCGDESSVVKVVNVSGTDSDLIVVNCDVVEVVEVVVVDVVGFCVDFMIRCCSSFSLEALCLLHCFFSFGPESITSQVSSQQNWFCSLNILPQQHAKILWTLNYRLLLTLSSRKRLSVGIAFGTTADWLSCLFDVKVSFLIFQAY